MKNPAPYRYDIVGSFLRTAAIHEARARFESGAISAEELAQVEDAEIRGLVQKEETVGLKAVTDGEYRRSFWHMDFLWGLTGAQKVKSEHFSVAFKGFQPKAETVRIVDKLDFPDDHPFLKHFRFLQSVTAPGVQPKQCIPSPSMLHLICCVREPNYQPIERYRDEQVLLDLQYSEDSRAQVDLNCVMNELGEIIELQGTGEGRAFTLTEQQELVRLCAKGNRELLKIQKEALGGAL